MFKTTYNNLSPSFKVVVIIITILLLSGMKPDDSSDFKKLTSHVMQDYLDILDENKIDEKNLKEIKEITNAIGRMDKSMDKSDIDKSWEADYINDIKNKIVELNESDAENKDPDTIYRKCYSKCAYNLIRNTEEKKHIDFHLLFYLTQKTFDNRTRSYEENKEIYSNSEEEFKIKLSKEFLKIMEVEKHETTMIKLLKENDKKYYSSFIDHSEKFHASLTEYLYLFASKNINSLLSALRIR